MPARTYPLPEALYDGAVPTTLVQGDIIRQEGELMYVERSGRRLTVALGKGRTANEWPTGPVLGTPKVIAWRLVQRHLRNPHLEDLAGGTAWRVA
jgi:hypothetical protein